MRVVQSTCALFALAVAVSAPSVFAQPAPVLPAGEAERAPESAPAPPPEPDPPPLAAAPPPAAADAPPPMTRPAPPPLKLENADASLKLGVLFQPQYEMAGSPTLSGVSHNLFVRRVRFLVAATLFKNVEFFMDTDYPDLFKSAPDTGAKNTPG